MRHQRKGFKLGRTHAHRKATLASLSNALITHKRITTTLAKARALRMYVEPIISRAKVDSIHNRRQAFKHLQNKHSIKELFGDIAEKVGDRPGGYTRIVKLGQRAGDSAEMAIIELVDFNEDALEVKSKESGKRRTRRSRRGRRSGGAGGSAAAVKDTQAAVETLDDASVEQGADMLDDAAEVSGEASVAETDVISSEDEGAKTEEKTSESPDKGKE